jgi:capsular exopolysaccharide synthesis family protein
MSRIYEALQRADIERKAAQKAGVPELPEAFSAAGEELVPVGAEELLENISLCPWTPTMASLPTLGERGDTIEQFRSLRSHIHQLRSQAPLKTVLISSGMPAEGKTLVAVNLAMTLARNKNNGILLIDADLRRPSLHGILGAPSTPGLADYLSGTAEIGDILQQNQNPTVVVEGHVITIPEITFIPGGTVGENSSELLAGQRLKELIATLSPHFDWILIDSPPVLAFADAIDIARNADGVLLVARGGSTPYDVAQRAQAGFSNSRILGFVLNAVREIPRNSAYYYNYNYSYHYAPESTGTGSPGRKDKRR